MQNVKFIRQPALRLFAAELSESKQTIIEHVEGRDFDSHCQLTPTGVRARRVLMMGALVEIDNVGTSVEYLRGRIVDPTGAFNIYAGQFQPEAFLSLSNLPVPCFVAVVGKTNAYRPDEETTIISIRLETIVEIEAKTRDYWVKETAAKTVERIEKSQLPEVEKEKYRQICRDALTKLVYMPKETSIQQCETPKEPSPFQEQDIPDKPTIDSMKSLMNEGRCQETKVGFLLIEEKPSFALPASATEKHAECEYMTSPDSLSIGEQKEEEPEDKFLIASQASGPKEQPRLENEISETRHVRETKESITKPKNSTKARIRKKKNKQEPVNNSQKTLFTEA